MWSNGAAFSTGWYHPVLKVSDITHHTVIPKVISQVLLECIHREASSYSNQIPGPPHLALLNPKKHQAKKNQPIISQEMTDHFVEQKYTVHFFSWCSPVGPHTPGQRQTVDQHRAVNVSGPNLYGLPNNVGTTWLLSALVGGLSAGQVCWIFGKAHPWEKSFWLAVQLRKPVHKKRNGSEESKQTIKVKRAHTEDSFTDLSNT